MIELRSPHCAGCGTSAVFVVTEEQFQRLENGEHIQFVLPHFSDDDREMLISGTCPNCWDEMFPELEDDWDDEEDFFFPMELLDPESDDPTYERDYFVEED